MWVSYFSFNINSILKLLLFKVTLLACEYRKLWFSKTAYHHNDSVTYGNKCVMIPYGEDIQSFIKSLLDTIQGIKTKKGHKEDLTLNCNKTKITINTYVNENCTFLTATNSSGDEVFTISDLNCVYKLFFVLRDIFPIGAFINKVELSIVYAFVECVKTCADIERQNHSELRSDDFIAGKILNKDPSLDRFKVKQLLNVNKLDLLCVANLNLIRKKKIEPIATNSPQAKSAPKRSKLSSKVTSNLESNALCCSSNLQNTSGPSLDPSLSNFNIQQYQVSYAITQQQPLQIVEYASTQQQPLQILHQPLSFAQPKPISMVQQLPLSFSQVETASQMPDTIFQDTEECRQGKKN